MGYVQREVVDITTDGSGIGEGYTGVVSGQVLAIRHVADGSNPLANTSDVTITGEVSGIAIVTLTNMNGSTTVFPRAATADVAGAAALYAAGGTPVNDLIPVAQERVKIAIAQGGASKTGRFHVYIG